MTITAAADGSALGNPGPAGWAWYIDEGRWRAGGWPHGTNNMGELKAVLDLLEATAVDAEQQLVILCDSQYVINAVTKWMPGWKRKGWRKKDGKPVLNVELLQAIDRALAGRRVDFEWVKGHAGHAMNEAADERARAAATAYSKKQDPVIGPGYGGSAASAVPDESAAPVYEFDEPQDRPVGFTTAPPTDNLFSLFDEDDERARREGTRDQDPGDAETAPGICVPDLDAAADALASVQVADGTPLEEVTARELLLLQDEIREDAPSAAALIHPDYTEIGASGRIYDRDEILAHLAPIPGLDVHDMVAEEIAPAVVLVRYSTTIEGSTAHRSSIWVHENDRWLLRHHQGTCA